MTITQKELQVIEQIAENQNVNQRVISKNTNLSLGLINLLIKRLVKKGYLKVRMLNRKKLSYILTSKGFYEKAKKSYNYFLSTVSILNHLSSKISEIAQDQYKNNGVRNFIIVGNNNEISKLIRITINSLNLKDVVVKEFDSKKNNNLLENSFFFDTRLSPAKIEKIASDNYINMLEIYENISKKIKRAD